LIAIVGFVLTYALRRSQVFAWWVLPVLVILSVTHSLQHRVRCQKVWLGYPNSRYRREETMEGLERVVVCGVSFDLAYVLRVEDPARFPPP
jgi:hypothetical protein